MSPHPPDPARTLRAISRGARAIFTAVLLFLALLSGSLKLHSDQPHGHDATASGDALVFADARHPDAPRHLEASTSVALRHCNTCLLQRDQVHGPLPVPGTLVAVPLRNTGLGSSAGAPRSQPRPHLPARAPPVA